MVATKRKMLQTNLSGAGGGQGAGWPASGSASGRLWTATAFSVCRHPRTSPSLGCFWWTLGNVTQGQILSSCNLPAASFSAGSKPGKVIYGCPHSPAKKKSAEKGPMLNGAWDNAHHRPVKIQKVSEGVQIAPKKRSNGLSISFFLQNYILQRKYYSEAPNVKQITAKLFWLKREKVKESQKRPISSPSPHFERTPSPGILRPQLENHWSPVTNALTFCQ